MNREQYFAERGKARKSPVVVAMPTPVMQRGQLKFCLKPIQKPDPNSDERSQHGRMPEKFTFTLADRVPHSLDLFWDIVDNLNDFVYYPDEVIPIVIRLCSQGLEQSCRLDMAALRRILWIRNWIHPSTPIHFEPKEP